MPRFSDTILKAFIQSEGFCFLLQPPYTNVHYRYVSDGVKISLVRRMDCAAILQN